MSCRLVLHSSLIMELHIRLQTNSSTSYQRKRTHTYCKERKKKLHQQHSNSYEVFLFRELHINKNWVFKFCTRCQGSREDWHRCTKFHRKLYQDQKESAMILVAGRNQQAPLHPEGMDGGWTGNKFSSGSCSLIYQGGHLSCYFYYMPY